jgi:1-acyl-sn-glycerol-3-phosphate acyltransferase
MASISIPIPKAEPQEYLLFAVRILWLALPLMILLPLHIIWHVLKLPSPWAMLYLRIAARAMGARVKSHGKPVRKDVLFIANHVSWHDIPILGGIMGTAFVAQDGVAKWPVIGWLAKLNRTIFISRTDKKNVANQIAELREAFEQNWSVTLFPEGTTSDSTGLLPFKQSLFESLAPPPKPMLVQPVLLDFGDAGPDIAWLGEETGWESAWRAFTRPGSYAVNVYFLEPFDPSSFGERKQLCAEARQRLLAAMDKVRERPTA